MEEAYSHEVSSAGFWPGTGLGEAAYYAYAYPAPAGFSEYPIQLEAAYFHDKLGEFLLPYEAVRRAKNPARHCFHSCKPPTRLPRRSQIGIERAWSERRGERRKGRPWNPEGVTWPYQFSARPKCEVRRQKLRLKNKARMRLRLHDLCEQPRGHRRIAIFEMSLEPCLRPPAAVSTATACRTINFVPSLKVHSTRPFRLLKGTQT
jgi:hypothetical protein